MKCLTLPLCPPNHRRDATMMIHHEPTIEDWIEYGKDLSETLHELSSWMQEQIQQLVIFHHGASTPTANAPSSLDVATTMTNKLNLQLIRATPSAATPSTHSGSSGGSNQNPCFIPITSKNWWYESRRTLAGLVPTVDDEDEEEEEQEVQSDDMSYDVVQPPPENLSRRQRYMNMVSSVRIEEVQEEEEEEEEQEVHPIDGDSQQSMLVQYNVYYRTMDQVYGPEGQTNMLVLNYLVSILNLYYLDHVLVGGEKWQGTWTHHKDNHMSFQGMVFLAIMQARILRQLFCELYDPTIPSHTPIRSLSVHGLAYKRLCTNAPEFKTLVEQGLVIPRTFPVSIYTQSEMDQSITTIMFKTNRVEWSEPMHHLMHLISDRMACFFFQSLPVSVLNVEGFRKPLPTKLATHLSNGQVTQQLYTFNFDFLCRCTWRYYYLMQDIMGFEQLVRRYTPQWIQQDVFHENQYTREDVCNLGDILKRNIQQIYNKYTNGEKTTINKHMRKTIIDFILPQGDLEWSRYKYPIAATNAHNIMEKLHATIYTALKAELFPAKDNKVVDVYFNEFNTPNHPLRFIHDYLILFIFDKHMVQDLRNIRFLSSYVIRQQNLHFFAKLLYNSHEPYIRQWMGRYYLCYNNQISFCNTTIYQVLAEWILIAFKFCPELWELIQTFGTRMLPAAFLLQKNTNYRIDIHSTPVPQTPSRGPVHLEHPEHEPHKTDMMLIL